MSKEKKENNQLKILNFCPYYPPHIGGLEKHAIELHEKLVEKNVSVTVFTPNIPMANKEIVNEKGVLVIRYPAFDLVYNFPVPKFWLPKFWKMFFSLFKKDYDAIFSITMFFHSAMLALLYSKIKRKPWIHIEHASNYTQNDSFLIKTAARIYTDILGRIILIFSNLNIAPSQSAAKFIARFTKKPSTVIYRGMPFSEIEKNQSDTILKEKFKNKKIITYVGRLISGKGIIDLVNAISLIKHEDFILLIVGDGQEEEKLKKLIEKSGIKNKIEFLGAKNFNEVLSIMKISDIFVNPSHNEGLPTTVLEASACSCAIVATDVGGTKEIVTDKKSAILIEPKNIGVLATSIERLLKNDFERISLSKHAKEEVLERFNWEKSVNAYIDNINSLINKK